MRLNSYWKVTETDIHWPQAVLEGLPCGLYRAPLLDAPAMLPEMKPLFESVPVMDPWEYEVDIKIHMLFPEQYPCIPNWHCDHVPRVDGKTDYSAIQQGARAMFLWISQGPHTEFLAEPMECEGVKSHADLSAIVRDAEKQFMPSQTWVAFNQSSPHRGTKALENCWRVFARVTHRSIAPQRPVNHHIRRHAQVYLDAASFSW